MKISVRELLRQLSAIEETVLIYPATGGRPKARRMTTELTGDQPALYNIFSLDQWAPKQLGHTPNTHPNPRLNSKNSHPNP